jgi:hypothetical protein
MTEHVAVTVQVDAQHDVERHVLNYALTPQLQVDSIQVNDRIDGRQGPVLPGFHQRPDFVSDGADGVGRYLDPVQVSQHILDVAG